MIDRIPISAGLGEAVAVTVNRHGVLRDDFRGTSEFVDRFFETLLLVKGPTPTPQGKFPVLGLLLLPPLVRLAVLLDRLVKALQRHEHVTKNVVGPRVIRIDPDGLPALLDGLFVVLLRVQGARPTPQDKFPVLGLLLLPLRVRLAVLLDRLVKALLRREHVTKNAVGPRVIRIDPDGLPAFLDGLFVMLLRLQGAGPIPQGGFPVLGLLLLPPLVRLSVLLDRLVKTRMASRHFSAACS